MSAATASGWEFSWEALVAIGTLLLALGTFALARQTAKEVRSHTRPVISAGTENYILVTPQVEQPTGAKGMFGSTLGAVEASVRNIGPGPALNVTVRCVGHAGRTTAPRYARYHSLGSLAPGAERVFKDDHGLYAGYSRERGKRYPSYEISCLYEDVSARRYSSRLLYELATGESARSKRVATDAGVIEVDYRIPHVRTDVRGLLHRRVANGLRPLEGVASKVRKRVAGRLKALRDIPSRRREKREKKKVVREVAQAALDQLLVARDRIRSAPDDRDTWESRGGDLPTDVWEQQRGVVGAAVGYTSDWEAADEAFSWLVATNSKARELGNLRAVSWSEQFKDWLNQGQAKLEGAEQALRRLAESQPQRTPLSFLKRLDPR